ncbi:MAG: hypothetical protein WBH31_14280, partial [Promethearchaeia archaeon]
RLYRVSKALLLKTKPRLSNLAKAEELLKEVIEEDDWQIIAIINLCDILLIDLRNTNDMEVVDEIKDYIGQLLNIAEKTHSYPLQAEAYLLQAKFALISLNLEEARRLLTQGQKIAEKYGLSLLARKISNEHDELLKRLDMWENLKDSDISLAERIELTRLNEQMGQMIRRRELELPDLLEEDPIVLLIISEGGNPLFSHSFAKEWSFEDHLFGGFLTAVNNFSNEMFSKGLDRAIFGEFTLLMKAATPFLVCYLFKGQSYLAQQRIRYFVDNIRTNNNIWQGLNKFYQTNQEIQLKDIPSLEPVISEIFIDKIIP